MYKKFIIQLFLGNMLLGVSWFCVKGAQLTLFAATPAFQLSLAEDMEEEQKEELGRDHFWGILRKAASGQRVVDYCVLEQEYQYLLSDEDYNALLKIVQAEAGNEDEEGKMLVAGVVLNRVNSTRFPNSVQKVVMQQKNGVYQFSPVASGSYNRVKISQETVDAVERVLKGEDISQGALYFASRKYADPEKMKWFDCSLTKLFEHGGHEFYTNG
ncbi:MAG: cell wall hydrolase [Lachnospiraceae bacterium]|nr:cell wall hydrolase [Lachnospiraceae bacterium]